MISAASLTGLHERVKGMIEVVFYGRGGQGAVTASQILATAAFSEGKYAQAFSHFGAERKGAPVMAFVRISTTTIEVRNPIEAPDIIIVLDSNLLKTGDLTDTLKPGGIAIINSSKSPEEIKGLHRKNITVNTIDATAISEKVYGQASIPRTNIAMLGAVVAYTQIVSLDAIKVSIGQYFMADNATKARDTVELAYSASRTKSSR